MSLGATANSRYENVRRDVGYLTQWRRVRAAPARLDFDDAFEFAVRVVGLEQKRDEIGWLFERVRATTPRVVVEIGVDRGGTLFLWSRAAAPDAVLVGLDITSPGPLGRWSPFTVSRRAFGTLDQRLELLLGIDSHAEATAERVQAQLGGRRIDYLFIDGDHSYDGVRRDFDLYSPLVRPGGLIGFHDVSPEPSLGTQGVLRFWRELKADHVTEEFVADGANGYGVGLYRVPL
jgi:predicted O-methyltransferase YrrM